MQGISKAKNGGKKPKRGKTGQELTFFISNEICQKNLQGEAVFIPIKPHIMLLPNHSTNPNTPPQPPKTTFQRHKELHIKTLGALPIKNVHGDLAAQQAGQS